MTFDASEPGAAYSTLEFFFSCENVFHFYHQTTPTVTLIPDLFTTNRIYSRFTFISKQQFASMSTFIY